MKTKVMQIGVVGALIAIGWIAHTALTTVARTDPQTSSDTLEKFISAEEKRDSNLNRDAIPGVYSREELTARDAIQINLGRWTVKTLSEAIQEFANLSSAGEQVSRISERFLGTPYEENTLVGSKDTQEKLTVHLAGLDCFTYIDYVEASRLSNSYDTFLDTLQHTRYRSGVVRFEYRNHFFSDWVEHNGDQVADVTKKVGGNAAMAVEKELNQKKDGSVFLEGIPVTPRTITYIPSAAITDEIMKKLHTGDYIGVYTDIDGLDVTHTGIFIRNDSGTYLRHASSREETQKVIDENFLTYLKNKPGIVVYRPQ